MAGIKGMQTYPLLIKEQAVRMHMEEGLTTKEIQRLLDIRDERRVRKWCESYRKQGLQGLHPKPKGRPRRGAGKEQEQPEQELKRLKIENELLRNFLYEAGRR